MMYIQKYLIWIICVFSIFSCGGGGDNNNKDPDTNVTKVSILRPLSNSQWHFRNFITFEGEATNSDGTKITGNKLIWESDIDGPIGEGEFFDFDMLSLNTHQITLSATDNNGEIFKDSIDIILGETKVEIKSPEHNGILHKESGPFSFKGEAFDFKGELLKGPSLIWTSSIDNFLANGNGFSTDQLSEGDHIITLKATDNEKEANSGTATINLSIKSSQLVIEKPQNDSFFKSSDTVTFSGRGSDYKGEKIDEISFSWKSNIDGVLNLGSSSFTKDKLSPGHHIITLSALDVENNPGKTEISLWVDTAVTAIETPLKDSFFFPKKEVRFSGHAFDFKGTPIVGNSLEWRSDIDGIIGTGTTLSKTDLSKGKHTITLAATDTLQNTTEASTKIRVSVTKPEWFQLVDYGEDEQSEGMALGQNNDIFMIGSSSLNNGSAFHIRFNDVGKKIWTKEIFHSDMHLHRDVIVMLNNESIVSLYNNYQMKNDSLIYRWIEANGSDREYFQIICGNAIPKNRVDAFALAIDNKKHFYFSAEHICEDEIIITKRCGNTGKLEWESMIGTPGKDKITDMKVDSKGDLIITGYTTGNFDGNNQSNTRKSLILAKINGFDNQFLWKRQYSDLNTSTQGNAIVLDKNNDCYITGTTTGEMNKETPIGKEDAFIAKFDCKNNGNNIWTRLIGSTEEDSGNSIDVDLAGNLIVTGNVRGDINGVSAEGGNDIFLSKYNTVGDLIWVEIIGGTGSDTAEEVAVDSRGRCILTGRTDLGFFGKQPKNGSDAFVLKLQLDQ